MAAAVLPQNPLKIFSLFCFNSQNEVTLLSGLSNES
jgi:hypothetical protein